MIEEKVEIIYSSIIEEGIEEYKQLFNTIEITEKTIPYWVEAKKLYDSLSNNEKHTLYEIIKQVSIDTVSAVFGLLDGSSSLPEGGTFEASIVIDGIDTEHLLQDYFLSIVQEKELENNLEKI